MNHLLYFLALSKISSVFFRVEVWTGGLGTVIFPTSKARWIFLPSILGEAKSWRVNPNLLTKNLLKTDECLINLYELLLGGLNPFEKY